MPVAASLSMTDAEPAVRLMLVDDDPMGLLLTARALRERGFEVLDFDRPDDAVEVSGVVHDVTPSEGGDAAVYRLTHYDRLTGLPNRTWLLERLQRPRPPQAVGRLGLTVLDIDRFRQIGETLGQECTDRLIAELAQRLRRLSADGPERGAHGWIEAVVSLRGDVSASLLEGLADRDALAIGRRAVEALMRWVRGGKTQPAGTFIPLAEETGLIVLFGEWAVVESREALAALRRRGHRDCLMSVNLSAQQLRTGRLPGVLRAALEASGVPADRLEVELTESGMMRDAEVAVAELTALRALGAGLAVDDFGTGYSSLAFADAHGVAATVVAA
ncbi:MAG: EAL domain-containing protein [Burkholderiales bacterium]|jgi:predicted signal transduction protein with EAL and GGDEF domain